MTSGAPIAPITVRPGFIDRAGPFALPPQALSGTPSPIALLRAFQRRWALAIGAGLLGAAVAAAVAWFVVPPSKYKAQALLHVSSLPPRIIFPTSELRADFATYQRTQLILLKSRTVLNEALRADEVQKLGVEKRVGDTIAWLEKEIQANFEGEVLRITMAGDRPDELKALVNAVAQAYKREVVDAEDVERRKRHEELKDLYSTYQGRLKEKRETLKKLAEDLGSGDKETVRLSHEIAIDRHAEAERELAQIRRDLRKIKVEVTVLGTKAEGRPGAAPAGTPEAKSEEAFEQDKVLQEYCDREDRLRASIKMAKKLARNTNDPSIVAAHEQLLSVRAKIAARRDELRRAASRQPRPAAVTATGGSTLRERFAILKELEKLAEADVKLYSGAAQTINRGSFDLEKIKAEIEHVETAAKKIGTEVESLNVELNAPPRVRPFESADAPRKEADKRPMISAMSGLGTLALIMLGVSWNEFRARRIESADEVVHGLGIRLVGALPALPRRPRSLQAGSVTPREIHWHNLLVESVNATRTMLLHAARNESIRAVMVTSATMGEGKTSLACHLATSLARAGRPTLLLDSDLRRPAAHRLFDLPLGPGFSEFLRGEATLEDVIRPTPVDGLQMITAGKCDPFALQALAQEQIREVFDRLRERCEFIIIDTPPVLPVVDALLIGQHADAAICSVLRGVSRLPKVYAANEKLLTLGIRTLGAVMAGSRVDAYATEYSYPSGEGA